MISSSVFHFTKRYDVLKLILGQKRLRSSLNLEAARDLYTSQYYIAIPMICFCDIPLKYVAEEHVKRYGKYGVGFTKEWAIKNQIQPILYRPNGSVVNKVTTGLEERQKSIAKVVQTLKSMDNSVVRSSIEALTKDATQITKLTKQIGTVSKAYSDVRENYLDREWRYIDSSYDPIFVNDETERTSLNNEYQDLKLDSMYLNFTLNDIEHIIVPSNKEVTRLLSIINELTGESEEELTKFKLAQKVIDINTVLNDM